MSNSKDDFMKKAQEILNKEINDRRLDNKEEESDQWIEALIDYGYKLLITTKNRIFARGLIMGVLTATSVYSIIIILVMMGK